MKILVTGAAGFIGANLVGRLLDRGDTVVGLDNINDYYPVELKHARLKELQNRPDASRFTFVKGDIADREMLPALFASENFDAVVNLAAQAGVRYSLENPMAYVESNLVGFVNVLECCRRYPVSHLVYASSSSVYGGNEKTPFSEEDKVDDPVSLYAATKKSNELMASCYSHLFAIPATGLRFFTVYGPWGRPDMAPMLFARAISRGEAIKVFNGGDMLRDFTYVDDIVSGVLKVIDTPPAGKSGRRHTVYNIGCSHPVKLMDFISTLEKELGREAGKIMMPMQPGDVYQTYADTSKLESEIGYKPSTTLQQGISEFVKWYKSDKNPLR